MANFSDGSIEQLMVENGRLQQEIALLHAQLQQLTDELNERKNAVEQIDIVQVVTDAIVVTDTQFRIISWNRAAETMYGWKESEVLGQSLTAVVNAVFLHETIDQVRETFLTTGYWSGRVWQHRKDGTQIPILSAVTVIRSQDGRAIGSVAVNRDIADQLEIEEALRQRTRALEARNEELAQFAYVASHDLQEPLRMITAYLQRLSERYDGQLDEVADEFIGYAVDGAARMQQLIKDLLTYAKIDRTNLVLTPVSLEKVLQLALANLDLRIQETQAAITYDPLPIVTAEKTQMLQLFQNLLSNAIKFRNNKSPRIHISAREEPTQWVIRITDNGIGIDPKMSERIFAIFQRLHTRQDYPGTGIGLAICKKIVQSHDGTIWLESEMGSGATFAFSLPISGDGAATAVADAS